MRRLDGREAQKRFGDCLTVSISHYANMLDVGYTCRFGIFKKYDLKK